jgi:hypothetical protein
VPTAPDTIGNWSSGELQKVIRDMVALLAPSHLVSLTVDDLIVVGTTVLEGTVTYASRASFFTVGTSGQPGFLAGSSAFGGAYQAPAFIKTEDGWVRMRGSAKGGTIGSSWIQLPPGFRPASTVAFATAGSGVVGIVEVDKNGNVTPLSPATNTRVSFDNIQFKTS